MRSFIFHCCLILSVAAALGCSGERSPETGGSPLGDLSGFVPPEAAPSIARDVPEDTKQAEHASENAVNTDKASDHVKSGENPTSFKYDICQQNRQKRQIQIIDDPTQEVTYDLEMLGIVTMGKAASEHPACLEAAIRDGAQVLRHTEDILMVFYPTRFEAYIDAAADRINIDAVEGRWSEPQKRIIPGVSGRKVNENATLTALLKAALEASPQFALVIESKPALSADLSSVGPFEPSTLLGEYTTTFARKKNRTINVKLAASALDGIFLMPGAEVSYNAWVGERSEARGFKEAPVIEQGEMVEGLGGGACQVSSTVHAAALMAGLGIEERYNHSLPSSYIPVGMDAVVSYPMLDLRIKNTHSRPVVLRVHTEDNQLIARFYSDMPRSGRVLFRREVSEEIPYQEVITTDPMLEPGTVKITKRGKVGYKVQRGRIFWENDVERYEKLLMDTYRPQTQHVSIAMDVVYPPPEEPVLPENAPAAPSDAI